MYHVQLKKMAALLLLLLPLAGCGSDGSDGTNGAAGANGAGQVVTLQHLASTASQGFAVSAAEIVAFDKTRQRIFTVNAQSGLIDVFAASDLTALDGADPAQSLDLRAMLVADAKTASTGLVGAANSISISGNLAAVAVEANPKTDSGWVVFIDLTTLAYADAVQVGALPDMLTFTPDASMVVVACEGEPDDYTVDPEGVVEIIDVPGFTVRHAAFTDFNIGGSRAAELPADVRIFGQVVDAAGIPQRDSTVAEDLEPEYVAVSADSSTAYVALQENNAIAVIDLATNSVSRIFALGVKNHMLPGNELDASNKDDAVNITNWPVYGIYMPDSIATYSVNGVDYLVTANEGDSRADWGIAQSGGATDFAGDPLNVNMEEFRVRDLPLDPTIFTDATLQDDVNLGRLKVTSKLGYNSSSGLFEKLYCYGGRSFSIWNTATGEQVFDSGSDFERITAKKYGLAFNNNHDETANENRSDDKGPEPEGLTLGVVNGHTYAFIALERMGGTMVYDISNPNAPVFSQYLNHRDLSLDSAVVGAAAGDLGPEGLIFINATDSPNGKALLVSGNEVSGTTSVDTIDVTLLQQ